MLYPRVTKIPSGCDPAEHGLTLRQAVQYELPTMSYEPSGDLFLDVYIVIHIFGRP